MRHVPEDSVGAGHHLMPSFGISKRIFPAAISSRATVTGLPESTSTMGSAPSLSCRARLAATITSAYLFSTRPNNASRGGLITCRHPRWDFGGIVEDNTLSYQWPQPDTRPALGDSAILAL